MSYPRALSILIIEDEPNVKAFYEEVFDDLRKSGEIASIDFAFCYRDAMASLESSKPYHLAIVDLRIPNLAQEPAGNEDLGRAVVTAIGERESLPIPGVLILSGYLKAGLQEDLEKQLLARHWYAKVRSKGEEEAVLRESVREVQRYCDVGVVVEESNGVLLPGLSLAEEDLIRRSVLAANCQGAVLRPWSAEYFGSKLASEFSGWTKVFIGRFLTGTLDSTPYRFFKFIPIADSKVVAKDADQMGLLLPHIKVIGKSAGYRRFLIVTEKVGAADEPPLSLHDFLRKNTTDVQPHLAGIIGDIVSQVERLGTSSPDMKRPSEWMIQCTMPMQGTDAVQLAEDQALAHRGEVSELEVREAANVTRDILAGNEAIRGIVRMGHGDLNATNVALDVGDESVDAYIFDAAGMMRQMAARDLAVLEVSTLLHGNPSESSRPVHACVRLYDSTAPVFAGPQDAFCANVRAFIEEIRKVIQDGELGNLYPLMLLDAVVGQVWGLAFSGSANKIKNPSDAVLLWVQVSKYVRAFQASQNIGGQQDGV